MSASKIYLAAWVAAENALPDDARALIKKHDEFYALWRKADFKSPVPAELSAASDAVEAHPLASIPFKLRQQCNQASVDEYRANKPAEVKV